MKAPSRAVAVGIAAWVLTAQSAHAVESRRVCNLASMLQDPPGVTTRVRVEPSGTRYRATLDIEVDGASSPGERVIEADSCDALAKSASVVISMAALGERERGSDNESAPPARSSVSPPSPPKETPRKVQNASSNQASSSRFGVRFRAEAVASTAMMPALAGGGGLALGLAPVDRLHIELFGATFTRGDARIDTERGATLSLISMGARACWAFVRVPEVAPCVGLVVDRLAATGFGALKVGEGSTVIPSPEAGLSVRVPVVGPVHLRAGLGVLAPLARPSFVITARGVIFQVPALDVRGSVGPEVQF